MAEQAGSIGARLDLEVRAGDTFGPFVATLTDSMTGLVMNITGYTFEGAVSKLNTEDGLVALTCTITDAVNGKVQFKASAVATTALADATSNFFTASAKYSWYLKGTDTAGDKRTYLFGYVKVAKELPT
jgi:hypothetical protein